MHAHAEPGHGGVAHESVRVVLCPVEWHENNADVVVAVLADVVVESDEFGREISIFVAPARGEIDEEVFFGLELLNVEFAQGGGGVSGKCVHERDVIDGVWVGWCGGRAAGKDAGRGAEGAKECGVEADGVE